MKNLIIHEELKNLLPPLSVEEYTGLEASILKDGCLSPFIVWNGILVDGHHRYEICTKHNIPFSITNVVFNDLGDAKLWAWKHQENRRNLTPFHRAELALKLKYVIAAKAKERQRSGGRGCQPLGGAPMKTQEELAQIARVSHDTLSKVEYIAKHADEETKEKLRRGDKGTSIHREYRFLQEKQLSKPLPAIAVLKADSFEESETFIIRHDTTPEELARWLVANCSIEYLRDFIICYFEEYRKRYGEAATQHLLHKTFAKFID